MKTKTLLCLIGFEDLWHASILKKAGNEDSLPVWQQMVVSSSANQQLQPTLCKIFSVAPDCGCSCKVATMSLTQGPLMQSASALGSPNLNTQANSSTGRDLSLGTTT